MSEPISRKITREKITQGILAGCFIGGAVLGGVSGVLGLKDIEVSDKVITTIFFSVLAVLAVVTAIYWRFLDEAAREAHKFAWMWGGGAGAFLSFPLLELMPDGALLSVFGVEKNTTWFGLGMLFMLSIQIIGYCLAWVGWWLARWR